LPCFVVKMRKCLEKAKGIEGAGIDSCFMYINLGYDDGGFYLLVEGGNNVRGSPLDVVLEKSTLVQICTQEEWKYCGYRNIAASKKNTK